MNTHPHYAPTSADLHAQRAGEMADAEFGYDWEALAVDPEFSRMISANDIPVKDCE